MKKGVKKGVVLLTVALMALESVPMTAVAAEENAVVQTMPELEKESLALVKAESATSGTLGYNNGIQWSYDTATKTLTVTGEDSGFAGVYDESGKKWISPFCNICSDVEKIIVQDCRLAGSVSNVFSYLTNLKTVEFKNINTSEVTSMAGMFKGCCGLESLDLSSFDTRNVEAMYSMFSGCSALKSLNISSFDTSKVTNMSMMFENCSGLESLDVSKFNTAKVEQMWYMFAGCSSLKALDVSNFNTANVERMDKMFGGCSGLESLDVSNFDTAKVTQMWLMFADCSALKTLDVSHFDTANVESMVSMFSNCSSIENLDVSGFDTSKITSTSNMFGGCESLKSLHVSNFNTSNMTVMEYMFEGCTALESLDVSNFDTSNVTNMKMMFWGCEGLERLDLSNFDMSQVTAADRMLEGCNNVSVLIAPKAMASGLALELPLTFHDAQGNEVTELSTDNCNTMLVSWENGSRTVALEAVSPEVTVGNTLQLTVAVEDEVQPVKNNEDYVWSVADESVVTISDTGVVTGVGMGETTVTCVHKVDSLETATFEIAIKIPFPDINVKDWQYRYVVYAYENKLMSGKGDGTFGMDGKLTRSEFVTVLYNYSGKPPVTFEQPFTDVMSTDWFASSVTWAKQNNVSAGNPDGTFGVVENITREQLVTMLYKFAKSKGMVTEVPTGDLNAYADAAQVSSWAVEAFTWAVQNNIVTGKNIGDIKNLDPQGSTTRGECATMMMKYVELSKSKS